jgi:hypothetical protein
MSTPISRSRLGVIQILVGLAGVACLCGALDLLLTKAVNFVRKEAALSQAKGNIHWLAFSMSNYESANEGLPPAALLSRDGKPLLSWRVLLLPFTEQQDLYQRFKLDEPWDSPHNRKLIQHMPRFYKPLGKSDAPPFTTFIQVIRGPGTPFERPGLKTENLNKRAGSTFLIVEAAKPVIWSKPEDLEYRPDGPLPELGGDFRDGFFIASTIRGPTSRIALADEDAIRAGITGTSP